MSKPQTLIESYDVLTGSIPAALTTTNLQLTHTRVTWFACSYCSMDQVFQCTCCYTIGTAVAVVGGTYVTTQCTASRRYDVLLLLLLLLLDKNKISGMYRQLCSEQQLCSSVRFHGQSHEHSLYR